MKRIPQSCKDKILLESIKSLPEEVLEKMLFNQPCGFLYPTDFYILDEENFSKYMKEEYKSVRFYTQLVNLYREKNELLHSELKDLLSTIDDIVDEMELTCVNATPTICDKEETLMPQFYNMMSCDAVKTLADRNDFDIIASFYVIESFHGAIDNKLCDLGIHSNNKYEPFIKLVAIKSKERYKQLNVDIEKTNFLVNQIEDLNLEDCKILKLK